MYEHEPTPDDEEKQAYAEQMFEFAGKWGLLRDTGSKKPVMFD